MHLSLWFLTSASCFLFLRLFFFGKEIRFPLKICVTIVTGARPKISKRNSQQLISMRVNDKRRKFGAQRYQFLQGWLHRQYVAAIRKDERGVAMITKRSENGKQPKFHQNNLHVWHARDKKESIHTQKCYSKTDEPRSGTYSACPNRRMGNRKCTLPKKFYTDITRSRF